MTEYAFYIYYFYGHDLGVVTFRFSELRLGRRLRVIRVKTNGKHRFSVTIGEGLGLDRGRFIEIET